MRLPFEQWPGTLGSVTGTPDRRPGSVRRTTSIRSSWPDGFEGPLRVECLGRDLLTGAAAGATTLDEMAFSLIPAANVGPGFRRATAGLAPAGSVHALLLDDAPAGAFVSGSSRVQAILESTGALPGAMADVALPVVCIGRRPDGAMQRARFEGTPLVGQGPPAGVLERDDDPAAWHDEPAPPRYAMRRRRRIDVWLEDDVVRVDSHFRDSRMGPDGVETSVHEYEVLASADLADLTVLDVEVRPRVLPGPDCPGAVPSAQVVVGTALDELRGTVRSQLRGDHVCTHLNDQLRSLADVPHLVRLLDRGT